MTGLALAALLPAVAAADSETFATTFGNQDFTVPEGITSVTVDAIGGAGATDTGTKGALGGEATGTFSVTPGQQFDIVVGSEANGTVGGGFNGGGSGSNAGGSGGGESDVRFCDSAASCPTGDAIAVAGGGGGTSQSGAGGGAGGQNGSNGAGAAGGGGGQQTATNNGGANQTPESTAGSAGTASQGGTAGAGDCTAGGGGGGLFGGGGGGGGDDATGCGGGGGGSSFVATDATNVSYRTGVADTAGDGNGQVTISWCCSSQTFGQPQDTSGNPLTSPIPADTPVVDSASVTPGEFYTGTATPSGTVSFYVCGPLTSASDCTSTADQVGSAVTLSDESATSSIFTPTLGGTYCFYAVYPGDSTFVGSSDGTAADQCFSVVTADTATAVTSSVNPSVFGQPVTFTATVGPVAPAVGTPTGTVTFLDGGSPIGTSTLSAGTAMFTTSELAVGSHMITASYGGDAEL